VIRIVDYIHESGLVPECRGWGRTITESHRIRLDDRGLGFAKIALSSEENEIGGIFMMGRFLLALIALVIALLSGHPVFAQGVTDLRAFEKRCTSCHGNPSVAQAPDGLALRKLTPEAVYAAITTGATHAKLAEVSDDEKRMIAGYLGGRKVDAARLTDAKLMSNPCPVNPVIKSLTSEPMWNGWGADLTNARMQSAKAAGLTADDVPKLKLKWAFGLPAAEIMWAQPTIAAGRVFVGADSGGIYSIDEESGCVHWSFQADAGVRNAITIRAIKGQGAAKYAVYFGDIKANVYAVDAATGKQIWKTKVEDHPAARITGSPIGYEDRLYVPVSSTEERAAGYSTTYPCCSFRGSVAALDANTGKQIWKTYIIPDAPQPRKKTAAGVQLLGPAGGAIWDTPTLDPAHHALYIGTGDAYTETEQPIKTTDGIMAINMDTGKVLWSAQDTSNDVWLAGCGAQNTSENCPKDIGPDYDFGSSPILRSLPNGHRILVAGQKDGIVWAHDPDEQGAVVWKTQLVDKIVRGVITFGGAADEQNAYFGLSTGGIEAVQLSNGEKKWFAPIQSAQEGRGSGQSAAITAIPGVIFSGGWDGTLRAFSTSDGHPLWQYDTMQEVKTVNGIPAKGGSMGAPGPTVAGGMLFVGSGYTFGAGATGNLLLAFSVR
jgi:polyvinyl alcohol dehydrogenase (cytochrome)